MSKRKSLFIQTVEHVKEIKADLTDSEIVAGILQGKKDLFELLMRKYNQRLYRIGRTYIRDDNEVEEIMQETYVKAYENLRSFEHNSSFSTWLIRILINTSLARIRKSKRLTTEDFQTGSGISDSTINSQLLDMRTPEQNTMNKELGIFIEKAIDELPEIYRTAFMMREIEKMSVAETGECLNISEANVKVRLNRAKEMLRENLTNVYKDKEIFEFMGERCDRMVEQVMKKIKLL